MKIPKEKLYNAALFDLDGTLIDSAPGIMYAMNQVLLNHNFSTYTLEEYYSKIGKGLHELVKLSLPEKNRDPVEVEQFSQEMIDIYESSWKEKTFLYTAIPKVLDVLSEQNIYMVILSNKEDRFVQNIAKTMLSRWNFKEVIGKTDTRVLKPDTRVVYEIVRRSSIPMNNWLSIGDSLIDYMTAQRSGMDFFHALWGYSSVELTNKSYTSLTPTDLIPFFEKDE